MGKKLSHSRQCIQRKPDSHFFHIGATGLKPTPEDLDLFNQYLGNKRPAFYQGAVDHIIPLEPENILNTFDDVWDVFVGGGFTGTAIVGKAESMRKHMNLHMSDLDPAVINLHNSVKIDERNAALLARLDSWEKFVTDLHLAFRDANGVVQPPNPVVSRYANLILGKMNQNIKHQQPIYNWTGIENNLRELYALEPRLAGVALPVSVSEPQMDLSLWNDLAFLELWSPLMWGGMAVLALLCFVIGVWPQMVFPILDESTRAISAMAGPP